MPEMVSEAMPAEMSFSDWKKMKNAMKPSRNEDGGNSADSLRRKNNSNNNNNKQFQQFKQNNQHSFNNGFCNIFPPSPNIPFCMDNSVMNNFSPQGNARINFANSSLGLNGSMNCNNFMMPGSSIPQKPFNQSSVMKKASSAPSSKLCAVPSTPPATNPTKSTPSNAQLTTETSGRRSPVATKPMQDNETKIPNQKPERIYKIVSNFRPPKPPPMIAKTPETKEQKQQLWREYRQKMKPFKNRDFYNAKRVVQRLGKKNYDELEDVNKERLKRAQETIAAYKEKLAVKTASRWTVSDESNSFPSTTVFVKKPLPPPPAPPKPLLQMLNDDANPGPKSYPTTKSTLSANINKYSLWNNFVPGGQISQSRNQ